jgi:DNA-binding CsgD family transcriptional regulator
MKFWKNLSRPLGKNPEIKQTYRFDETLVLALRTLAKRQQRPEEEVAAELLGFALEQRQTADLYLRYWQSLTPREQEVAALACRSYTNQQVSKLLTISPETVKTHLRNILGKFGLHRKFELIQALANWDFSAWEE